MRRVPGVGKAAHACIPARRRDIESMDATTTSPILATKPLGFTWPTLDPFLFCAHHDDAYPAGDGRLGPAASLEGRELGSDFAGKDGWRMYHGETVPGFPAHPHRGFETVTIVRHGLVDHADSLGAAARFGDGDVQWLTAGRGIAHAEMFPLLDTARGNRAELFQVWLNLPAADKIADPHFSMLWAEDIPARDVRDADGRPTRVTVIAGGPAALAPPPASYAARPEADVAIWTLRMAPHARFTLPRAAAGAATRRALYFFAGTSLSVDGTRVDAHAMMELAAGVDVELVNGDAEAELLMLQGRPLGEPVAQHGPFVMNTRVELVDAFADYQRTRFGGWPWPDHAPVHGAARRRFARHVDGRVEERPVAAAR